MLLLVAPTLVAGIDGAPSGLVAWRLRQTCEHETSDRVRGSGSSAVAGGSDFGGSVAIAGAARLDRVSLARCRSKELGRRYARSRLDVDEAVRVTPARAAISSSAMAEISPCCAVAAVAAESGSR